MIEINVRKDVNLLSDDVGSPPARGKGIGPDAGARNAGNGGCCLFLLRIRDAPHECAAREGECARGDAERTGRTSRLPRKIAPHHHLTAVDRV